MKQMIRKQIYLERRQDALLKRLAKKRRLSEAEIIRQALDREFMSSSPGPPRSEQAMAQAVQFMQARRRLVNRASKPYKWQREDAYGDRAARYERNPA